MGDWGGVWLGGGRVRVKWKGVRELLYYISSSTRFLCKPEQTVEVLSCPFLLIVYVARLMQICLITRLMTSMLKCRCMNKNFLIYDFCK